MLYRTYANAIVYCTLFCWIGHAHSGEIEGFLEPYHDIEFAAPETGVLSQLHVRLGDRVKAQQLIAELDRTEQEAKLKIAVTEKAFEGAVNLATAETQLNQTMVDKIKELQSRDHASDQEVKRAVTQFNIARAKLQSANEQKELSRRQHDLALVQLNKRKLLAPISGIVTEIFRDPGEYVSFNQPSVVRIVQLDPLLVVFSVPIPQARNLAAGNDVNVTLAYPTNEVVTGEVEFVSPTPDPQSGTTSVRVRIPNPDEQISSGIRCCLQLSESPQSADQFAAASARN